MPRSGIFPLNICMYLESIGCRNHRENWKTFASDERVMVRCAATRRSGLKRNLCHRFWEAERRIKYSGKSANQSLGDNRARSGKWENRAGRKCEKKIIRRRNQSTSRFWRRDVKKERKKTRTTKEIQKSYRTFYELAVSPRTSKPT